MKTFGPDGGRQAVTDNVRGPASMPRERILRGRANGGGRREEMAASMHPSPDSDFAAAAWKVIDLDCVTSDG